MPSVIKVDQIQSDTGTVNLTSTVEFTNNVGMGVNSPQNKLHIARVASLPSGSTMSEAGLLVSDNSSARRIGFGTYSDGTWIQSSYPGVAGPPYTLSINPNGGAVLVNRSSGTSGGGDLQISSGITFPATQVASSDPNTLDDYEEGTWTPSLAVGGSSTGITYATERSGSYTKIGRQVTVRGSVRLTSKGSNSGSITIEGLPFVSEASGYQHFTGAVIFWDKATVSSFVTLLNGTTVQFRSSVSTGDTNLVNTDINNGTAISFSATYSI